VDPDLLLEAFDPGLEPAVGCQVLVCTDVLGQGHNLQRASALAHLDRPWNPVRLAQREGRLVRSGQLADPVHIAELFPSPGHPLLDGYLGRLDRALARRSRQASELWRVAKRGDVGIGSEWSGVGTTPRTLLDALFGRIAAHRRHPNARRWLDVLMGWRHVLERGTPAGLRFAIEALDLEALPPDPQAAIEHIERALGPLLPVDPFE